MCGLKACDPRLSARDHQTLLVKTKKMINSIEVIRGKNIAATMQGGMSPGGVKLVGRGQTDGRAMGLQMN